MNTIKKRIFDEEIPTESIVTSGFQTAGGRSIAVKKELLNQMKDKLFDNSEESTTPSQDAPTITSGFQTATGRSIVVNKDLVTIAQEKFNSKDSEQDEYKALPSIQSNAGFKVPSETVKKPVAEFKSVVKQALVPRKVDNSKSYKRPQLVDKSKLSKYIDDSNSSMVVDSSITANDSIAMEVAESSETATNSTIKPNVSDNTFKNVRMFNMSINDTNQISYLKMKDLKVIAVSNENDNVSFYIVKPVFDLIKTDLR
jgi:hypothetical protein